LAAVPVLVQSCFERIQSDGADTTSSGRQYTEAEELKSQQWMTMSLQQFVIVSSYYVILIIRSFL